MGDFFSPDAEVQQLSLQTEAQQSVQGPLSEQFLKLLGGQFGLGGAQDLFEESFLGPAMRGFERQTLPAIQGQFANVGGTLSSRRPQVIANALRDVQLGSQAQFGQLLPALLGFQTNVLGIASQFALDKSQENLVIQQPSLGSQISSGLSLGSQAFSTLGQFKG